MFFKKICFFALLSVCILAEQDDVSITTPSLGGSVELINRSDLRLDLSHQNSSSCLVQVTRANFEQEVLHVDMPVILYGYAAWCLACHQMKPTFEEVAKNFDGKAKFVFVDTQADFQFSLDIGIQFLPTVLFFKEGKEVGRTIGCLSFESLTQKVECIL